MRGKRFWDTRGLIVRSPRRRADGHRSSDLIRLTLCDTGSRKKDLRKNTSGSHVSQSYSLTPSMNPQILSSPKAKRYPDAFEAVWKTYPHVRGRSDKAKSLAARARLGGEEQVLLSRAIDAFSATPNATKDAGQYVKAFERWIAGGQWRDFVRKAAEPAQAEAIDWAFRMAIFRKQGTWLAAWGEKPDRKGCQVPGEVLEGGRLHSVILSRLSAKSCTHPISLNNNSASRPIFEAVCQVENTFFIAVLSVWEIPTEVE